MAIVLPPRARRTLTCLEVGIGDALGTYYFVFKEQPAPLQLD
jgi:hypothetical protein